MSGTLLFSGTDIATLVDVVEDLSDFWSGADSRGDLPTYAGTSGATATRRPTDSKVRTGQVTITDGATLAATEDRVAALKAVLRPGQSQTVTRRKVTGTGNLDTTQTAIVRPAIEERWLSDTTCTLIFAVETVDGPWYGASQSIGAAGTVTVKGDVPTRSITATLSAGAANPVVTNTTNGYNFRYVGTVPTGGVTVDVRARKATKVSDSSDVSSSLKWSKDAPFQLDPGSQTITVSAGSVSFTYLPAYV
jgi:hypothetical protein